MNPARLRRTLLALVGTGQGVDLAGMALPDWQQLDQRAAQHRLQPLLHCQHRHNAAIPETVRAGWAASHRAHAMLALGQQADLSRTYALLREAGFTPLALKGAWLSRHAYPDSALRPMRDIDLLLDPATVIDAFRHLQANGYELLDQRDQSSQDLLLTDKHLPPLRSPAGTVFELHHRLWEQNGRLDHASPHGIDAAVRQGAVVESDGIAYPAPADMLAHLIVHAVYSHRLDCGPLLLADIDFLLRARSIDWAAFWNCAAAEGWRSGARLVLALVATWRAPGAIVLTPAAGPEASAAVVEDAADLLLQDLKSRHSAGFLASIQRHGWQALAERMAGRTLGPSTTSGSAVADANSFARWAASRLQRTVFDLVRSGPRRQGQALARLSRWLDAQQP